MKKLCAAVLLLTTMSYQAYAEPHYDITQGVIFQYDPDVGVLNGVDGEKGQKLGDVTAFDITNSTISFWVNLTAPSTGWASIFRIGNSDQERYPGVWLYPDSSAIHYRVGTDSSWNAPVDNASDIPLNTWTQIAVVFDDGIGELYYNNTKVYTSSQYTFDHLQTEVGNTTWSVYGSDPWFTGFQGKIDDVKVYDRALTQEELALSYNSAGAFAVPVFSGFLSLIMLPFLRRKKA